MKIKRNLNKISKISSIPLEDESSTINVEDEERKKYEKEIGNLKELLHNQNNEIEPSFACKLTAPTSKSEILLKHVETVFLETVLF